MNLRGQNEMVKFMSYQLDAERVSEIGIWKEQGHIKTRPTLFLLAYFYHMSNKSTRLDRYLNVKFEAV